eukprot:TRINITY_DN39911_c0_g1_i1.p1 TRINITY_DN39911_c0_g1~~TRINITY_DN39911_c0_g1_i1.p1  ORF type:complete len:116 (-),score=13.29 TRINITY_DN39911_c0_g1_i1:91-438(-)
MSLEAASPSVRFRCLAVLGRAVRIDVPARALRRSASGIQLRPQSSQTTMVARGLPVASFPPADSDGQQAGRQQKRDSPSGPKTGGALNEYEKLRLWGGFWRIDPLAVDKEAACHS